MKKKKSLFKKLLLLYSLILVVLIVCLTFYVNACLKEYNKYDTESFIKQSIKDLEVADLKKLVNSKSLTTNKYEKYDSVEEIYKGLDNALEDGDKITYQLSLDSKDDKQPIYDIYYNKTKIFTLELKKLESRTKLGLLNYDVLKVVKITSSIKNGLYEVKAAIPSKYKLYINSIVSEEGVKEENTLMSLISTYSEADGLINYEIKGLISEPKIEIKDETGKVLSKSIVDNKYTVDNIYFKTDSEEEANSKIVSPVDVMDLAEKYSLFLTNDLTGANHGFGTLSPYLIKGTEMYTMAYKWAHEIDITFTSKHSFKAEKFTNEKLSNYVIYSKDAFSVDVYLEKNMIVTGKDKKDIMNNKITFVYYNGSWKILDITAV